MQDVTARCDGAQVRDRSTAVPDPNPGCREAARRDGAGVGDGLIGSTGLDPHSREAARRDRAGVGDCGIGTGGDDPHSPDPGRRDGAGVGDGDVETLGTDSVCHEAGRRDGAGVGVGDGGIVTSGLDSVYKVAVRLDASVVGDSVTCRRGRDARRLRDCWRAEAADEGSGREQQDKAGPQPLGPGHLLSHAKALTQDALVTLREGIPPLSAGGSGGVLVQHCYILQARTA